MHQLDPRNKHLALFKIRKQMIQLFHARVDPAILIHLCERFQSETNKAMWTNLNPYLYHSLSRLINQRNELWRKTNQEILSSSHREKTTKNLQVKIPCNLTGRIKCPKSKVTVSNQAYIKVRIIHQIKWGHPIVRNSNNCKDHCRESPE